MVSEGVFKGIRFRFRTPADRAIIHEVFDEDPYEVWKIPEGATVVDVGAHIGTFTLRAAVERGCRVYAYEPVKRFYELLIENAKLNGVEDRVRAFNSAVGRRERTQKIGDEMVRFTTLANIMKEVDHCAMLKMDCEGCEREVLLHNEETSACLGRIDRIVLEWHNFDGRELADCLDESGFSTRITGTGENLRTVYPDPKFERGMLYAER